MRGFATAFVSIGLMIFAGAARADIPDMAPLDCAWGKLLEAEQTRLKDGFKVDIKQGGFTLFFADGNDAATAEAARACQLTLTPDQTQHLAAALARRAALERAKKGIADKNEDPAAIHTALRKMHDGKRELIGDKLSCPGPHDSVGEWDESVRNAVRKANLGFKDGRAYAWVSLGLYASFAQEGAMRRMNGKAEPC